VARSGRRWIRGRQGDRDREGRARRGGDHERRDGAVRGRRSRRHGRVQGDPAGDPRLRAESRVMGSDRRPKSNVQSGYVVLEDGTRFDGRLCGAEGSITGEVVFNTAMTGYQEAVTDPSYAGQIIAFTYPLVGNYGVRALAMESDRPHARAVIMREGHDDRSAAAAEGGWLGWLRDRGVAAITGVDTREVVRTIRDAGAMRGGIFHAALDEADARMALAAEPPMAGADLARTV